MAVRRVSQLQIPQFSGIPKIDSTNFRQFIDKTAGTQLEGFARRILSAPGTAGESPLDAQISEVQKAVDSASLRLGKSSPYQSRINLLEQEVFGARNTVYGALQGEVTQAFNLTQPMRWRGRTVYISVPASESRRSELQAFIDRMKSASESDPSPNDSNSVRQAIAEASTLLQKDVSRSVPNSTLATLDSRSQELAGIQNANLGFQRSFNPDWSPVPLSERTRLQNQLDDANAKLTQLNVQAAEKVKAAATQFNREQQQGSVAASSIRTVPQRPLTGRFGTPQTGVGIAARGAL